MTVGETDPRKVMNQTNDQISKGHPVRWLSTIRGSNIKDENVRWLKKVLTELKIKFDESRVDDNPEELKKESTKRDDFREN